MDDFNKDFFKNLNYKIVVISTANLKLQTKKNPHHPLNPASTFPQKKIKHQTDSNKRK